MEIRWRAGRAGIIRQTCRPLVLASTARAPTPGRAAPGWEVCMAPKQRVTGRQQVGGCACIRELQEGSR